MSFSKVLLMNDQQMSPLLSSLAQRELSKYKSRNMSSLWDTLKSNTMKTTGTDFKDVFLFSCH